MMNTAPRSARTQWIVAFVVLALGVAAAIAAGNVWLPASAASVLRAFVPFGVAAGVPGAIGMWLGTRGISTGTRAVLVALVLAGAAGLTGGVLLAVNRLADGSPGSAHFARIAKKSQLSNRQSDERYDRTSLRNTVSVTSWIEDGKLIEVYVVGIDRWDALRPGDVIRVVAHDGKLGWPWVEAYRGQ
jgi:hypothetical protein